MNLFRKDSSVTKNIRTQWLIILLLTANATAIIAQTLNLGWTGKEILPLNTFINKSNWICNFQHYTGDSAYVTTDDSCVYLHWKFGTGKRYKFAQCYQYLGTAVSLANKDIVGVDVKGSKCTLVRNINLKFEDGIQQSFYRWDGLAGITRWCERISVLKKQFNNDQINWGAVRVVSLEVNAEPSDNDIAKDSGVVAFRKLSADSVSSWTRANKFEALKDSNILPVIIKQTVNAILNRQNTNTGLFSTWLTDQSSYLYGQGLVMKILSLEGKWNNTQAVDSCAKAAEKLAMFFVNHQDQQGFWPRAWHTQTGEIMQNLESDGTVWMGDFPWIITGLQNYYKKSHDYRVKVTIDKAKSFLYDLIENDSILYTINPATHNKYSVTSGEAYAAAILSVLELGDSVKAARMLRYIDRITWDGTLQYWKEALNSPRIVLFANTWLSALLRKTTDQKPLNALSFVSKALYTRGPGEPAGFDGIGPIATWYEGTLSYICAGGPGSNNLFYNLINYRYSDGTVPHYNDSVSLAGIWGVKWSSLDGTSWLYFAASKKSPFDVAPGPDCKENKKVLMHYMGWFGDSLANNGNKLRQWNCGEAREPLIGKYDSHSWSLLTYHMLLSWSCGIDGMILNVKDQYDEQTLEKAISAMKRIQHMDSLHFTYNFAISYDDQGFDKETPLDTAVQKLTYLRDHVLPNVKNYLHYYDRPAVFIYNYNDKFLSAKDYRNTINNVFATNRPMILWNSMEGKEDSTKYIDCFYPWVQPGEPNYPWNGTNWGKPYLDYFYGNVNYLNTNVSKLSFTCGGVWAGFDDRKNTCWGSNRVIERRNGVVYDSTWKLVENYNQPLPLKWVVIETWNDWNEGSEIEPSKENGYQYLKSTIDHINTFKDTSINKDTCKFEAAKKIYMASILIEHQERDSAKYYPMLTDAIKSFLLNHCNQAIATVAEILKQTQHINFDSIPLKTYGDNPFSLHASSSSGLPLNYNSNNSAIADVSGSSVIVNNAGSASVIASQAGNDTIAAASATRTLTIKKVLLTVTADNKTRKSGEHNPELTFSYTGFVNNEHESVLDVKPVIKCTADSASSIGQYDIVISEGADNNYDFKYVNGKLTILPTGLNELSDMGVEIYPNPAKDKLLIKLTDICPATIQLCSSEGKVILEKKFINKIEILDISQLSRGIYMIKVIGNRQMMIRKVLLQ
jgi:hypothetical protein